jgi:L-methionine (R)-S-oxide reductase
VSHGQSAVASTPRLGPTLRIAQVHADASNFLVGVSKQDAYKQLLDSMTGLVQNQRNWVCNTANAASLLWHLFHALPPPSSSVNWSGFYVVDKQKPDQLILAPFHGKVACQSIQIGKGVCGTVAAKSETLLLRDVESFPGHIACDGDSKSEVVVPIVVDGKVCIS